MTTRPDLRTATAAQLRSAYADGTMSPIDAALSAIAAAQGRGSALNAVAALDVDRALEAAHASAERWRDRAPLSPLDGVPVSIKDSFAMVGLKRWHGSRLNDQAPPSSYDAAPVRRLREGGAVLFAKSTMPDFGLIAAGVSSQFGIIRNPWNPEVNPGGSSSGAGVLVAVGAGPLALGTDMGGSVRIPAALCGLVGLKPTQGRIAYDPPKLVGSAGPMARTVVDAAALLGVVGQADFSDHLSLEGRFGGNGSPIASMRGKTVGVLLHRMHDAPVDPVVEHAVRAQAQIIADLGAEVHEIESPLLDSVGVTAFHDVIFTRGLPEMMAIPQSEWQYLPSSLHQNLMSLVDKTAIEHVTNEKAMEAFRARISAVLNGFDYVLSPVLPMVSFPADQTEPDSDEWPESFLEFTLPYNLSSFPAGVVPVALSIDGLPIAVQVGGRRFDDAGVLSVLAALESARGFDLQYPDQNM